MTIFWFKFFIVIFPKQLVEMFFIGILEKKKIVIVYISLENKNIAQSYTYFFIADNNQWFDCMDRLYGILLLKA